MKKKLKGLFVLAGAAVALGGILAGCGGTGAAPQTETTSNVTETATTSESAVAASESSQGSTEEAKASVIDYMVLVNKENPLPDKWEQELSLTKYTNSLGDEVETESKAYEAYLKLKEELEKEGVKVDLDSAFRSTEAQEEIVKEFTEKYGEVYVKQYVAVPGFSEHHTGLALDLYLNIDGKDIYYNEDMVNYPDVWAKIHNKLTEHGFILRYLEGKESVTGYNYEPWHIRYIGDAAIAKEITDKGITLEEYLNILPKGDVTPPKDTE